VGREFLPLFQKGVQEFLYVFCEPAAAQLIGLSKYYAEGDGVHPKPLYELQVYLLRFKTAVYQYKQRCELGALQYVAVDYPLQFFLLLVAPFCITVARQVNQVPVLVYEEMVDKECLARCSRCHGQPLAVSQHIDKAGLAHVGAPYKSVLRAVVLRAFADIGVADYEFGTLYLHLCGFCDHKSTNFWPNQLFLQSIGSKMNKEYPSSALERAVGEFSKLPGIGRKTALRLVLHMLSRPDEEVSTFGRVFTTLKQDIHYCKVCHNISDSDVCDICANPKRDGTILCVVENVQDVLAIESTMQYNGLYHVLGGIISPMDGIGPQDLQIASLVERVQEGGISEVILALSPTMEGDTTNFFISRKLQPLGVKLSVIARGVAVGNNLEYADEVSLGRSIVDRIPFS